MISRQHFVILDQRKGRGRIYSFLKEFFSEGLDVGIHLLEFWLGVDGYLFAIGTNEAAISLCFGLGFSRTNGTGGLFFDTTVADGVPNRAGFRITVGFELPVEWFALAEPAVFRQGRES